MNWQSALLTTLRGIRDYQLADQPQDTVINAYWITSRQDTFAVSVSRLACAEADSAHDGAVVSADDWRQLVDVERVK